MKACPFCAEEIQDTAIVCKHCGRDLKGGASQVQLVQPKKNTGCVAGGCAVLLVFFVVLAFVGQCQTRRPPAPPATGGVGAGRPPATLPRSAPPPTTLSAAEQRLGPRASYCNGRFLKNLGIFTNAPPCVVEAALAQTLHDPSSFEMPNKCQEYVGKTAWVYECTFRAKNAFGALIVQKKTFWVKNDRIVKVTD